LNWSLILLAAFGSFFYWRENNNKNKNKITQNNQRRMQLTLPQFSQTLEDFQETLGSHISPGNKAKASIVLFNQNFKKNFKKNIFLTPWS
jgi:hypothetical protein